MRSEPSRHSNRSRLTHPLGYTVAIFYWMQWATITSHTHSKRGPATVCGSEPHSDLRDQLYALTSARTQDIHEQDSDMT